MTRIDHEKKNKKANAFHKTTLPLKGDPSLRKIKLSEPIVDYKDLLKGDRIRSFQEDANVRIKSPKELKIAYQTIACSCLSELARHRDIRQITKMFNNMPPALEGARSRMANFLSAYGPVKTMQDDSGKTTFRFSRDKKLQLGYALEQPWWGCKP